MLTELRIGRRVLYQRHEIITTHGNTTSSRDIAEIIYIVPVGPQAEEKDKDKDRPPSGGILYLFSHFFVMFLLFPIFI